MIQRLSPPWVPSRYGKAPYFWLLSFLIFGWKYLYVPPTATEIICLIVSLLVFLPFYFYSLWHSGWKINVCIAVSCALGILWAPYNYGGSSFCIFAATMCSRQPDTRKAYLCLLMNGLTVTIASIAMRLETYFWAPTIIFGAASGLGAIISERLTRSNESLLKKQEEVEYLAALTERERIARDLHDLLGHSLSVITLKAELAGKLLERNPTASKNEIADIERTARQALAEVRAAVVGYRASGLKHELQSAQHALEAAQVALVTEIEQFNMPPSIENVVTLAVREAVTNIMRHAQASKCHIRLAQVNRQVLLKISDNGIAGMTQSLRKGSGLNGMTERVQSLGGSLHIHTTPQAQGLHLELSLPIKELT